MTSQTEPHSLPPAVRRVASAFRFAGWISFWGQIVLAVVSSIVLAFAGLNSNAPTPTSLPGSTIPTATTANPGTGLGLFLAVCGLVVLFAGAYWAFYYTRLSLKLKTTNSQKRPKRGDVIQALRIGLIFNLSGMLLTLLGAQAIVGTLVARSLAQGFTVFTGNFQQFIRPIDIFVVQANTNTILAHFIGLLATLWLIRAVSRQG